MIMRIQFVIISLVFLTRISIGASLNFSGNFRTEGTLYNRPGLGVAGTNPNKSFMQGRALLNPKLVVDDRFSIKSQWSLLTSPNFTPNATEPLGQGQGGFIFGDPNTAGLVLSRAWLEWTSDFGVIHLGRMPVSWGYGLIWDSGDDLWDDFQTTRDRFEYRLQFGHIVGALTYSKARKLSVLGTDSDQDFYGAYLKYDNPEEDVEGGVIAERQIRTGTQADLIGPGHPYHIKAPAGVTVPPLANQGPYPKQNWVLDAYLRKTVDRFTFGGEVAWVFGTAVTPTSAQANMNAVGGLANISYEYHKIRAFLDFLYASGQANLAGSDMNGFAVLHRNRRPGLILGRELLGNFSANQVGQGSLLYYEPANVFSGAWYLRPGFRVDWSDTWGTGIEFVYASKAVSANNSMDLGFEVDLGVDHAFYKNFEAGLDLGYLFPGSGLGVANAQGVFAVRALAGLKF